MLKKKNYIINIIIILIISGLCVYFTIGSNLKETLQSLKQASLIWLFIMFFVMSFYYIFDSLILYILGKLYNKTYSFKLAFINSTTGTLFNGITPFASGGQFMQVYLFNKTGINPSSSSGILLTLFITYQSILVIFSGLVFLVKYNYFKSENPVIISLAVLGFVINVLIVAGLFLFSVSKKAHKVLTDSILTLGYKLKIIKNLSASKDHVNGYLSNFRKQVIFLINNKKILIEVCLCNVIKLLVLYSMPFLSCKAIGVDVSISQFEFFICLSSLIYLINAFIPIPGSSGGSEGCYLLIFSFLPVGQLASTMVLWRFVSYYLGLIVGSISFAFSFKEEKK